ncbi:MAG: manganese efflux pump MntP family protein [Candidatus Thermoplasmatota archaeon]|nr:manganese efflux pump [Euryarchaeota archaeon]MBU4032989.1 manganese efflux pump MntP family protein [Candidatus Thermoplasmatota archaeon]MBU4071188.1 manganese efflux pump MntP family protein [Candidatus Thermoplasmatota archaeon]MBU4143599.1 manganese efflux pump MntP family protein [Candidatus Thermoplasmatota archaeon]MBU4591348.1 manganese efflux pump MntP family protein [Candidatus Thermoplasmatota archaeon]
MDYFTVTLTAVGLAMDCLAVSLSCGIVMPNFDKRDALRLGLFFGGFQAMMFALGWVGGTTFAGYIESVDHWIAFGLLLVIGLKMIHEGLENKAECANLDIRNLKVLFVLSIATSIDALAIGISYAILEIQIIIPAIMIGIASLALAFAGGTFGSRLGERFGKRMEIVGGLILIGLGIKILAEHMWF